MSAIVDFLEGRGADANGRSISDVQRFDSTMLERHHDFIQWLFPLPEPSCAVPGSLVLTETDIAAITASALAQSNLVISADLMLAFYRISTQCLVRIAFVGLSRKRLLLRAQQSTRRAFATGWRHSRERW